MSPEVRHTYFGDPARPLFGALHLPADRRARGGVVVCPPVGKEQGDTVRGQRLVAELLAEAGVAVLRYDHLHTAESWGRTSDPETAAGLVGGLEAAMAMLREAGAEQLAVVGLRLGALVAAQLPADRLRTLAALVLWEPVLGGRSWLRAERARAQLAFGESPDDGDLVHLIGGTWHRDALASVGRLAVSPSLADAVDGALVVATGDPTATAVRALGAAGAEVLPTPDAGGFVHPASFYVELPVPAARTVADRLTTVFEDGSVPLRPVLRTRARMTRPGTDAAEVETTVGITDAGVVHWVTAPVDAPVTRTLLTHATANDVRTGPAGLWAELAIDLAAEGVRTLRHDRRGVGESGQVDAADDYAPIHGQDQVDDAASLLPLVAEDAERPPVHAGVCSGSWVATAVAHREGRGDLVLVNHLMWRLRPTPFSREDLRTMGVSVPEDDGRHGRLHALRHRLQPVASRILPWWAWQVLGRLHLAQVPDGLLRVLAHDGLATSLVFSEPDHELFVRQQGERSLATLRRGGWAVRVVDAGGGDHAALHPLVRRTAYDAVRAALDLPTQPTNVAVYERRT